MEPVPVEEEPEDSDAQATPSSEDAPAQPVERKTNFQKVVVTEVTSCVTFWAQAVDQGKQFIYKILTKYF